MKQKSCKQSTTEHLKSKQQHFSYHYIDRIINFSKFFQSPNRSNSIPTIPLPPIIVVVILSAKSDHKPIE